MFPELEQYFTNYSLRNYRIKLKIFWRKNHMENCPILSLIVGSRSLDRKRELKSCPRGEISTTPTPDPTPQEEPSKNKVQGA